MSANPIHKFIFLLRKPNKTSLRHRKLKQDRRIQVHALPSHSNVQMRPRGPAGASAEPDYLASRYVFPLFDLEFRKMHIYGQQSLSVVEHYTISFKKHWPRHQHRSAIQSRNGSPFRHGVVEALVRALNLSVESPLRTEYIRSSRV